MLRDFSDARESCLKSPRHVNQSIWWGSLLSRIKDFYSLFSVLRLTKTGRHKILKAWKLFLITPVFSMHTRAKRFIPHFRFLPYTILWSARVKTGSKLKSAHTIDHTENCRECRGNAFDHFFSSHDFERIWDAIPPTWCKYSSLSFRHNWFIASS